MSRRANIGEASSLLSSSARSGSNASGGGGGRQQSMSGGASTTASRRSVSQQGSNSGVPGGPTVSAYSDRRRNTGPPTKQQQSQQQQSQNVSNRSSRNTSRNATPTPNTRVPQPTPKNNPSGLVSTPGASTTNQQRNRTSNSPIRMKQQQQQRGSSRESSLQQQQQGNAAIETSSASAINDTNSNAYLGSQLSSGKFPRRDPYQGGEHANNAAQHIFTRSMVSSERSLSEFKTEEAKSSLLQTVDNEKHLQELVKARRDRSLEVFQMYRDEADEYQHRIDVTQQLLTKEERRRMDLARQAREVETEALNTRHKLRQVQSSMKKNYPSLSSSSTSGNKSRTGAGDGDIPHTIIRSMLQKYNTATGEEEGGSSDDEYSSALDDTTANTTGNADMSLDENNFSSGASAASGDGSAGLWFTSAGKKKKRKLTKIERIQAAGKIADELDKSIRATRLSVESRVAELEATLSEAASLQNQRVGFGVGVDEMREKVKSVHTAVKQASWLRSCLPLLEQTVTQREALASQGEEYGRKVLDSLMALNQRDDEILSVSAERAERNLFRPDELIRQIQEENQHMSKELSEAVRDAEAWRASMQAQAEKYQTQLRETEVGIDEASRQRQAMTF